MEWRGEEVRREARRVKRRMNERGVSRREEEGRGRQKEEEQGEKRREEAGKYECDGAGGCVSNENGEHRQRMEGRRVEWEFNERGK